MNNAFQLVLLPGLGADGRLLEPQRRAFPQLLIPTWLEPRRSESLPSYGARLAETICVSRDVPLVLGGVSLGGMIAYEMARHVRPDALVLIASCRTRRGLRNVYRVGNWLLPWLPAQTWSVAKWLAGPVIALRPGVPMARKSLALDMFRDADSRFMHWALQALLRWRPTPIEGVRVFHIHGARDQLIPASRVQADLVLPDGGHLINATHAEQVNAFLAASIGQGG